MSNRDKSHKGSDTNRDYQEEGMHTQKGAGEQHWHEGGSGFQGKGGMNYQEMRNKIIVHAWKDPNFKKQLLSNPKAALKSFGLTLPENLNIKVMEEPENTFTLVLPKAPAQVRELSEKELFSYAGGAALDVAALGDRQGQDVDLTPDQVRSGRRR